jgi:DNA repair protein RecO (recombination protein O)
VATTDGIEAIVLRTTKYGEADVIAQLHTRDGGRRGVIAKGARKTTSRLGVRLDPFLVVRLSLVTGRGDLAIVRGVEVIDANEHLRMNWHAQQLAAVALELVGKLGVEHEPNEQLHFLARGMLAQVDASAAAGLLADERMREALATAFELKLLHVAGIAPQLVACVRCGATERLTAYSATDGGMVCADCRTAGDVSVDGATYDALITLMRDSLATTGATVPDELPPLRPLRAARAIATTTLLEHTGVRARS